MFDLDDLKIYNIDENALNSMRGKLIGIDNMSYYKLKNSQNIILIFK